MEDVISINEEAMDKLVLSLYDYSDRINKILDFIDETLNSSFEYFEGSTANQILNKYKDLSISLKNLKYNISSYSEEFLRVKSIFRNNASMIAKEIKSKTSIIQNYDEEVK